MSHTHMRATNSLCHTNSYIHRDVDQGEGGARGETRNAWRSWLWWRAPFLLHGVKLGSFDGVYGFFEGVQVSFGIILYIEAHDAPTWCIVHALSPHTVLVHGVSLDESLCKALLKVCRALLKVYRALLRVWGALVR